MTANTLEARLRRLEDIEAIRQLKARYLYCCDRKDPEGVRDCFAPGEVEIDYGRIGVFTHRDQLVEVFTQLGCVEHVIDMHHGVNPQIEILDETTAKGSWGLHYVMINTRDKQLVELGAYYEDEYVKLDGQWKIRKTRSIVDSTRIVDLSAEVPKVLFAGAEAPASVDDPSQQA